MRIGIMGLGFVGILAPALVTGAEFSTACVVADHPLASEAGAEILRAGGNVVDAAVATAFALSVVRPESCGVGGGGFMVIWNAERQEATAIDYRERAPARAYRNMYLEAQQGDSDPPASQKGGLAVAVPGDVAGLCFAHARFGSLDRNAVLAPAIRLAREGFLLDQHAVNCQRQAIEEFNEHPEYHDRFNALWRLYLNEGRPWSVGDRFRSPLGPLLELIALEGTCGFQAGPVANAITAEVQRRGGILTAGDLACNAPVLRRPLRGRLNDYDVLCMPPPSSGGVALLQILNILEEFERLHPDRIVSRDEPVDPDFVQLVVECMKHAFADRAQWLGDSDFAAVPIARLTSPDYARDLASRIVLNQTQPLRMYGSFRPVDDDGTSHFCVLDNQGNAVACTETINTTYGSYVVEPHYGILLNNEMDDLATLPGQPNAFGLVQSEANAVAPGKKPLSSMSPTILLKDGKATVVVGASGGPRIITATLLTLLNLTRFQMSVENAVAAPRYHHQWLPETIDMEPTLHEVLGGPMQERGHRVSRKSSLAAVQAAVRTDRGVAGASDPRKGGRPAGY